MSVSFIDGHIDEPKMTDNEIKPNDDIVKAIDILSRFDFFYGQRAGRELWNEKPIDVQNKDIEHFEKDVAFLKDFINRQKSEIKKLDGQVTHLIGYVKTLKAEKDDLKIELQAMRNAANGYKAEVERLKDLLKRHRHYTNMIRMINAETAKKIKAEAVKEFAGEFERSLINMPQKDINYSNLVEHIDNLVKERGGEK